MSPANTTLIKALLPVSIVMMMSLTTSFTRFCGLNYDRTKDVACCKANQLVIRHYYSFNVFFIEFYDGFTDEKINGKQTSVCNMRCDD